MWRIHIFLEFHNDIDKVKKILNEDLDQIVTPSQSQHDGFTMVEMPPKFTRVIDFHGQKFVVGPALEPGTGKKDAKKATHDPKVCQHPSDLMLGRGTQQSKRWWTCQCCQSRWERIPLSDYNPVLHEAPKDTDILTYGQMMGYTYIQAWNLDQQYCQWTLMTAESTKDASAHLKRFAAWIVRKEQQIALQASRVEVSDEDL